MSDYNKDSSYARNEYRQTHEARNEVSSSASNKTPIEPEVTPVISPAPKKVSVINWFFSLFVCYIPVFNIITLLIWAFSGDTNPSKKSFAKAKLVWIFIELFILVIVSYFLYGYIKDIMQL